MKTLLPLTLIAVMIAGCAPTPPNTDDTLTTQMKDANIDIGGITDRDAQDTITAICNARKNDLTHDWVLDTIKIEFDGQWSAREAEQFITIAYANACPRYRA